MNSDTGSEEKVSFDEEIDLRELFNVLLDKKKFIFLLSSFFAIISVTFALYQDDLYRSEALLSVSGQSQSNNSLSSLGGLASIAGINLPLNNQDKSVIVIKTIQSRAFLKHLISFKNILPSIMATKGYDFQSKRTLFDPDIYDEENDEWLRKPSINKKSKPTYLEAYKSYLEQVSISKDETTSLISISVEHMSPIFAKEFLGLIIREANELLRNKDLRESSDAIAFLNTEIPKSSLISMKDAINKLVQSQLETQMLSKINTEYILKIIEPPFIPETRSKPNRALICILGTLFGGIISILWVLIGHYSFKRTSEK